MEPFSRDEIIEIASSLDDYHRVFYQFFEMSGVFYTDSVTSAAVRFHRGSHPDILVNRGFWEGLTHRERLFVICHECLHALLNHGVRNGSNVPGSTTELSNVAQDICINEMIVSMFGFDRDDIREWRKYCWIDTCFDDPTSVKKNETFDYYLELLVSQRRESLPELFDVHTGQSSDDDADGMVSVAGELVASLSRGEVEKMSRTDPTSPVASCAGTAIIDGSSVTARVRFSKIVGRLKRTRMRVSEVDCDSFVREDRRYASVSSGGVSIPGQHPTTKPKRDRLLTVVFMDISGSCVEFVPTFDAVYDAFDRERGVFEIEAFTFDVRTREHARGQRIVGGGGTRFHVLEERVQEVKSRRGRYPDCVVVITDGDGTPVSPEVPSRWVWLLTPDPKYAYIHRSSKKYLISQVIF